MVKVREDHPVQEAGRVDLDWWLLRLQQQVEIDDMEQVRHACEMAKQVLNQSEAQDDAWSGRLAGS